MTLLPALLAWATLVMLGTWIGWRLCGEGTGLLEIDLASAWMAGGVALHLLLQSLDAVGVSWSRGAILAALALAALASASLPRRRGERPAIGGGARLLLVLVPFAAIFVWAAWTLRATASDFVYHWGIKGHRFALHAGIDWAYLELPENGFAHPDYPMLVSEQFAATAVLGGGFAEPVLMLWSVVALLLLLAVAGRLLLEAAPRGLALAATVGLAGFLTAFSAAYFLAGGADLHIALALLGGAGLLTLAGARNSAEGWVRVGRSVGWVAAFAAASKIEGIPFAIGLVCLWLWCRVRASGTRPGAGELMAVLAPPVLVVSSWWALARQHQLFQPSNLGAPDFRSLPVVQEQLLAQLSLDEWHGLPWLALLLPLLLLRSRSRPFGLIAGGQLTLFAFVYVSAPFDPVFWIVSSFPRALAQFLPTAVVGLFILLAGATAATSDPGRRRAALRTVSGDSSP